MIENGAAARRKPSLKLLVLWPAFIILGAEVFHFTSGLPIAFINSSGIEFLIMVSLFGALAGMIAGVLVGVTQRLLLPAGAPWSKFWIRATFLGWTVGGSIYWLLSGASYLAFYKYPKEGLSAGLGIMLGAGVILVAGIIIGTIQELFMQRSTEAHNRSWPWLRASAVGWSIGLALWVGLTYVGSEMVGINYEVFRYLLLPMGGSSAGIFTALAMDKLIPTPTT
ncbi:MAG: hypothetical protein M3441_10600 [Chloroflexota bacterium]|nr:hypothetical protein [Chloroflexota bacterium]